MNLTYHGNIFPVTIGKYSRVIPSINSATTATIKSHLNIAISSGSSDLAAHMLIVLKNRKVKLNSILLRDAIKYKSHKVLELLLQYKFTEENERGEQTEFKLDRNYNNGELLADAISSGETHFVDILLRNGADPNINNARALYLAVDLSRTDIAFNYKKYTRYIKTLLEHGANPNLANGIFLELAAKKGLSKMVVLLCRAGANPHANRSLALVRAAENDNPKCILALLFYGARFEDLESRYRKKYSYLKDIIDRHESNQHEIVAYEKGCCLFYWKSEREKLCDYMFKLQAQGNYIFVKPELAESTRQHASCS